MKVQRVLLAAIIALAGCHQPEVPAAPRPSILLVTLDTTRADAIGPGAKGVRTPAFDSLVSRGLQFHQAYTPVPQTLAAHCSIMTGLYPGGHGVHENGRYLSGDVPLLAEKLRASGYRTAAFVSAFALARRFGLGRGFDIYDDQMPEPQEERQAKATTDRALEWLNATGVQANSAPLFLWVHYYDPHFPYTPPEPYRTQYAAHPYLGEIASMDAQLGRLTAAFEQKAGGPVAIIVLGDHGEGLGDHGESQHGDLLYQATMHVPLVLVGPGIAHGVDDRPVSTRRVFHTVLDWAGLGTSHSLRQADGEVVLAEAMKPFLDYGWQPQVMAVEGRKKAILAGRLEVYDVVADPAESHDLAPHVDVPRSVRVALQDYPIPSPAKPSGGATTEEERRKLASLGYVSSEVRPVIRKDAPRPADMARLFPILDESAALFVRGRYAEVIPLLRRILTDDPHNLDAALRLATSYSQLGRDREAVAAFERARQIAPDSSDVKTYLGLHYARGEEWRRAIPLLESVVTADPDRLPALEGLAAVRERQGRIADAIALRQKIYTMRTPSSRELVNLGELAMGVGNTAAAIDAFERARSGHDLELGVLYLAAGRLQDAREALDRVPSSDPGYPMALFKRAQVSVLLHDPDAPARIAAAREHESAVTRDLIAHERLFR